MRFHPAQPAAIRSSQRLARVAAAGGLALLAACGDPSGNDTPGPASAYTVVGGSDQTAVVASTLAQPLVVKVTDARGRPVPNQLVNFVVASGGGSLFAGATQTDAAGLAADRWTLGPVVSDSQRVEVRGVDPETGQPRTYAVFRAAALPAAPASLVKVSGDGLSAYAGLPLDAPLEVRVTDAHANGVPGQTVTWTTLNGSTVTPGGVSDAQGIARAEVRMARVNSDVITAHWSGHTVDFPVVARPVLISIVSGDQQQTPAGSRFPDSLVVRLNDPAGRPVPAGVAVEWRGEFVQALASPLVSLTRGDGTARATALSENAAGLYTVVARYPGESTLSPTEVLFRETATGPITIGPFSDLFFSPSIASRQAVVTAFVVTGDNPLTQVTASIAGRSGPLSCVGTPPSCSGYRGTLDLSGVGDGSYPLSVSVQDASGNAAQRTLRTFFFAF